MKLLPLGSSDSVSSLISEPFCGVKALLSIIFLKDILCKKMMVTLYEVHSYKRFFEKKKTSPRTDHESCDIRSFGDTICFVVVVVSGGFVCVLFVVVFIF